MCFTSGVSRKAKKNPQTQYEILNPEMSLKDTGEKSTPIFH